jgi:hypothetical protein
MELSKLKDLAITTFFITATIVVGITGYNLNHQIDLLAPKLSTTITQANSTFQQLSATAKSWKEEVGSPDAIKARERAQLAGAAALEHLTYITLPAYDSIPRSLSASSAKLGEATEALTGLVGGLDKRINGELLPEIVLGVRNINGLKDVLEKLAVQTGADTHQVAGALNDLVRQGVVTVGSLNERIADLEPLQQELLVIGRNIAGVSHNLDATTAKLPGMVGFAAKWEKPLAYAHLISILAAIFKPW